MLDDMTKFREKVEASDLTKVDEGIFEVTFITEGKGSSGTYDRELLAGFGPQTFGPGVPNFFNHVGMWEDASERDIRTAAAKIIESWYTDEGDVAKVRGKIKVLPEHIDFVEFFMESFGLSISVEGTAEYDEETGEMMVRSFNPSDPYRSVDFVVAPGAKGSIDEKLTESIPAEKRTKILESMRFFESQTPGKPPTASVVEKKDTKGLSMEKDVEERFAALETLLTTALASKQAEAQAEADASAVDAGVAKRTESIKTAVDAVEAARDDLLPSQFTSLSESAWKGEDVSVGIVTAKAIATEAREAFGGEHQEETGRIGESLSGKSAIDLGKVFG